MSAFLLLSIKQDSERFLKIAQHNIVSTPKEYFKVRKVKKEEKNWGSLTEKNYMAVPSFDRCDLYIMNVSQTEDKDIS